MASEDTLLRRALAQVLRQDISTSVLDTSLTYRISEPLQAAYNDVYAMLLNFTTITDFNAERTTVQLMAMRYRMLLTRTMEEFVRTNEDINRLSPDQMTFVQNLTVMGGKLQSYTQLLATAANHAKIYDKLREAAILSELSGQDALEYLRRNRDANKTDNPGRSDIKEVVTTNRSFESLVGIDNIITGLRQTLVNIDIGLVDTFLFYIFYGIPGTGKTAISEAMATQFSNGEFYKFDQSFFASTYLGVTESRIRNIFETVRANPNKRYTIVIDEADNVIGVTPSQTHLNSIKILLQTEISSYQSFGPNLIICCITNYLNRIDQTFKRRATDIINVPPPSNTECLNFLQDQLTIGNEITWSPDYRNALASGFDAQLVYTNSDMGRLAKNVRDNFLLNLSEPTDEIAIEIMISERIIVIYGLSDISRPLVSQRLRGTNVERITGTYLNAMRNLASYLVANNVTLLSFRKFFAPNVSVMLRALRSASTLSVRDQEQYLQV